MTGQKDNPSIVVAGGGTAGHIEPALAVADAVRDLCPEARITALGTARGLETTLVPMRGFDLELIPPVPVPRHVNVDLARLPLRVAQSVRTTRNILKKVEADVVIGFGGYVSAPAYLACAPRPGRKRIPFFVHEANARAGMANKLGVRLGGTGLAAVSGSGLAAEVVGIPVRKAITQIDRHATRKEAREFFDLPQDTPVVFITGGSQGAQSINKAAVAAAQELVAAGISVLHAYGKKNEVELPELHGAGVYRAVPYIDRMDLAYSAADLIVCRSGAMSVAEISALGLPAIFVPLPHGNGEQALNAKDVVEAGGGIIVRDAQLSAETFKDTVIPLVNNADKLAAMSQAAENVGHGDTAYEIARRLLATATSTKAQHKEGNA